MILLALSTHAAMVLLSHDLECTSMLQYITQRELVEPIFAARQLKHDCFRSNILEMLSLHAPPSAGR